jgi:hypothetical protein
MIQFDKYTLPEDSVRVTRVVVDYGQPADCCEDSENWQTLRLETADGGGGPFVRMSLVDCDHYSVTDIHDLEKIFKDFKEKVNYVQDETDNQAL